MGPNGEYLVTQKSIDFMKQEIINCVTAITDEIERL